MIVILFGPARSGKDTVADFMVKKHGFIKVAFADPIKRATRDWFDWDIDQVWGNRKDTPDPRYKRADGTSLTPRFSFQFTGTEIGRELYDRVWADYGMRVAKVLLAEKHHALYYSGPEGIWRGENERDVRGVVFSDGRFLNEALVGKENGAKLVNLVRKNRPGLVGKAAEHRSETEAATIPNTMYDHHLINGGEGLDLLEAATTGLVETLLPT